MTNLPAEGVNVKTVSPPAGHANVVMTLNIYAHNIAATDEAAVTLVDASLKAALEE